VADPPTAAVALKDSQPAGSPKVTRVIYLENAQLVTGEILHVDGRQSTGC
jgi:hypothetical protein